MDAWKSVDLETGFADGRPRGPRGALGKTDDGLIAAGLEDCMLRDATSSVNVDAAGVWRSCG